jgi:hypothetical protein
MHRFLPQSVIAKRYFRTLARLWPNEVRALALLEAPRFLEVEFESGKELAPGAEPGFGQELHLCNAKFSKAM